MAKVKFDDIARECRNTFKGVKNDVAIVGLEHIVPNEMLVKDYEVDAETTFSKSFKKGQILFGRRRAYQQKAGVATFDGICSGDITVIEAIPGKVDKDLLPFIIQNERFFEHAVQGSAGSLSPRVKWEHLASYEFDLPPLNEQKRLADKLWTAYRLIESYKKLLAATDEMVKSQFIEMFGDSPKRRLGDFCELKARIGWQGLKHDEFLDEGYYYLVTGVDFNDSSIDWSRCHYVTKDRYDQDPYIQLHNGDILVTKDGTIGKVAIVSGLNGPATLNSGVFVLRDKKGFTLNKFLFYSLLSKDFEKFIEDCKTGSTIAHLNQKAFVNYLIPTPEINAQKRFVVIAEQADKSKFELRKSIEAIDQVIKSLINDIK